MRYLIFATLTLFLSLSLLGQSDCEKFRTGKFQNVDGDVLKSRIERNESIQIEKYGEIEVRLQIHWMDDCTYRLEFIEGNDAWWARGGKDRPTPDLIVRITETQENSYLQESHAVDDVDFIYKSQIVKIE